MTRRIIMLLLLCFVILSCSSCTSDTEGWQTVALDCGTIKIPENWSATEEDGLFYVYDEFDRPVMIEATPAEDVKTNKYYENYTLGDTITSAGFSNGAIYGSQKVTWDGKTSEKLYLDFGFDETRNILVVWDSSITKDMLKKIAKTYVQFE